MLVYPTLVSNNPLRRSRASETLSRNSLRVPWSWCSRANSSGVSGGPGRSALFLFFAFSAKALCAGRLLPSPAPTVPRAVFLRRVSAAARAARPTVPVFLQGQHGSVDFRGLRAARRLRPRDPFRPSTPGPLRRRWGSWAYVRAYTAEQSFLARAARPGPAAGPAGRPQVAERSRFSALAWTSPVHHRRPHIQRAARDHYCRRQRDGEPSGLMHGINSSEFQGSEAPQRGGRTGIVAFVMSTV